MKVSVIETTHYTLRPFKDGDAVLWQVWDIDPDVQSHMPEPMNDPQSLEEQLEYIRKCGAEEDGYYWSIDTKDGVTIGTVALTDINDYHKQAELGVVIGNKSFW